MRIFAALFFVAVFPAVAQKVEVPSKLEFAGLTLIIRDDARREIQKDVDALTASPRHYQIKAERAKTYFPIIEKVFREEGLPDDFKYLVLQESALIPDAVSTSNAVGFWQFKDFTAIEMGLRVDREIDERLNITASSRAAARYLIKNNQFFDNWIFALQAYQMGAGGVMKSVKDTQAKATRMEITGKTYWYVKKFLAHKIAYEGGVNGPPTTRVLVFENKKKNTLSRLAKETQVDVNALRDLNKWTRSGEIPDDRPYVVLLPVEGTSVAEIPLPSVVTGDKSGGRVTPSTASAAKMIRGKINGVHTVQAVAGDDVRRIAARAAVDVPQFLKWNDLQNSDSIIEGQVYFLGRKRLKGSEDFHKVSEGETLWAISQRYGIQLKRLKRYNRLDGEIDPVAGTMLFMASKRPKADPVLGNVEDAVEVSEGETFNWSVMTENPGEEIAPVEATNLESSEPVRIKAFEAAPKAVDSLEILQTSRITPTLADTQEEIIAPLPENLRHTVKAGETLYGIARLYRIAVMDIVSVNELRLQDGIRPGQVLKLPQPPRPEDVVTNESKPGPENQLMHEVKTSDTLYSIARQYNVTIKEIMEWNEKKDFSLTVGEKIRIIRSQ